MTLARTICSLLDELLPRNEGAYQDLLTFVADRPGHDLRYAIDHTKLTSALNWRPRESLESGLKKTVRWYLQQNLKR